MIKGNGTTNGKRVSFIVVTVVTVLLLLLVIIHVLLVIVIVVALPKTVRAPVASSAALTAR